MNEIKPAAKTMEKITAYSLAMNYLPILHLLCGMALAWQIGRIGPQIWFWFAWIYLLPPLLCRIVLLFWGRPSGAKNSQQDRSYKIWWFTSQLQTLFNRLPLLEELLRLVPGLYALWLCLWGGRVSPFSYWAPGARVLDRYLIQVDKGVVVGTGALLSGHLALVGEDGRYVVDIETITLGQGAIIGANAGLGPGVKVASAEMVPAGRLLPPYCHWMNGRKVSP